MAGPLSDEESLRQWQAMQAQNALEEAARKRAEAEAQMAQQQQPIVPFDKSGMIGGVGAATPYQDQVAAELASRRGPASPADVAANASAQALAGQPVTGYTPQGPPAPSVPSNIPASWGFGQQPQPQASALPPAMRTMLVEAGKLANKPQPQRGGGGGGPAPSPWMLAVNPYANAAHQDALRMSKQAIAGRQALGERAAGEDASVFGAQEKIIDDASQRYADMKAAQAAQARAAEEKYTNALEAMGDGEIDSNRWWDNKSTGQKIATGLGAVLAGIGSGLRKESGTNAGINMLNSQMAEDIASQRDKYARLGKKAEGYQSLYGQMMRRFGDEEQAFGAAMALGMNKAQAKLRTLAAARGSDEAKLRAEELMAKLAEQEQQWLMAVYKPRPTGGGLSWKDQLARKVMEKRELGRVDLEQAEGKAQIEAKYSKKGDDATQKGEQAFASALQGAKIPESLATIAGTEQALERAGGDLGGRIGRALYNASPKLYEMSYGPEKYAAMQSVEQLMMAGRADVFGSAYSKEQGATFDRAFQAGDTEGLKNSIAGLRSKQESKAQTLAAGYDDKVRDLVLSKSGLPLSQSKPKSFKAGE